MEYKGYNSLARKLLDMKQDGITGGAAALTNLYSAMSKTEDHTLEAKKAQEKMGRPGASAPSGLDVQAKGEALDQASDTASADWAKKNETYYNPGSGGSGMTMDEYRAKKEAEDAWAEQNRGDGGSGGWGDGWGDGSSSGYITSSDSGGEPMATGGRVRAGGLYHVAEGGKDELYVQDDGDTFPLTEDMRMRPREDGVIVPNPEVARMARSSLGRSDPATTGPGTPQRVAGPGTYTTAAEAVAAGRRDAGLVPVRPQGSLERRARLAGVNNLGAVDPTTGQRSDGMESYDMAALRRLDPNPNKPLHIDQPNGWGGRDRAALTGDEKYAYLRDTAVKNMEASAGYHGVAPPRNDPNYAAIYRKNYINNGPESVAGWEKPAGIRLDGVMTNRPAGGQPNPDNAPVTSAMERSLGGRLVTNKDGTMTLTKPGSDDISMDGRVMDEGRKPQDLAKFRPMGKGGEDDLATYMAQNLSPEDLKKNAGAIKALQERGKGIRDAESDRDKMLGQIAGGSGKYSPQAEEALAKKYGLAGGGQGAQQGGQGKPLSPEAFLQNVATLKTVEEQKAAFKSLPPEQRAGILNRLGNQSVSAHSSSAEDRSASLSPRTATARTQPQSQAAPPPAPAPNPANRYDFDYAAGVGGPVSQQGAPANIESPAAAVRRMIGNRSGGAAPSPEAAPTLRSGGVLPTPEFMTPRARMSRWEAADAEDADMQARLRAQARRVLGLGSYAVTTPDTAAFR